MLSVITTNINGQKCYQTGLHYNYVLANKYGEGKVLVVLEGGGYNINDDESGIGNLATHAVEGLKNESGKEIDLHILPTIHLNLPYTRN